jgi:hypothetical protein
MSDETESTPPPARYRCGHCGASLDESAMFFQLPLPLQPTQLVVVLPFTCPECCKPIVEIAPASRLMMARMGVPRA